MIQMNAVLPLRGAAGARRPRSKRTVVVSPRLAPPCPHTRPPGHVGRLVFVPGVRTPDRLRQMPWQLAQLSGHATRRRLAREEVRQLGMHHVDHGPSGAGSDVAGAGGSGRTRALVGRARSYAVLAPGMSQRVRVKTSPTHCDAQSGSVEFWSAGCVLFERVRPGQSVSGQTRWRAVRAPGTCRPFSARCRRPIAGKGRRRTQVRTDPVPSGPQG